MLIFYLFLCLAGYNHVDVTEYLLLNKADVNVKDKGGLVPLHNASSYGVGHMGWGSVYWLGYMG